jgi:phosphoribosylanthranilate isomerase
MWVKVDGVTRVSDVHAAVEAGVSAIGMIFAPSKRLVSPALARELRAAIPDGVLAFGVFADDPGDVPASLELDGVQLPASCPARPDAAIVLRTVRVRDASDLGGLDGLECTAAHLDAWVPGQLGGTGVVAPWDIIEAHRPSVPFVISGGLRPENVAEAVRRLRPAGVDVSSGVESSAGVKDAEKLRAFVGAARHR